MNFDHLDKILISDLLARGHLGVPEAERANPQDILINLTIFADVRLCGANDCIDDTVDYSFLSKQVVELVEKSSRHTVEALATDIANLCLTLTHVAAVRVRVDKPHRVRFTRAVGVEIERSR